MSVSPPAISRQSTAPSEKGSGSSAAFVEGDVVDEVIRQAQELDADLVVMVTEGRHGLLEALRGTNTEQVLRRLECPLLMVPDPTPAGLPAEN